MPVATPVLKLIVATAVLLLLHMPPETELVNEVEEPAHTVKVPVMIAGD
jgi:hypothetical protein